MSFLHQVAPSLAALILQIRVKNLHKPEQKFAVRVSLWVVFFGGLGVEEWLGLFWFICVPGVFLIYGDTWL